MEGKEASPRRTQQGNDRAEFRSFLSSEPCLPEEGAVAKWAVPSRGRRGDKVTVTSDCSHERFAGRPPSLGAGESPAVHGSTENEGLIVLRLPQFVMPFCVVRGSSVPSLRLDSRTGRHRVSRIGVGVWYRPF